MQTFLGSELTFKLDQTQRRKLAGLLKFSRRPPNISHARWRVMQLGGADHLTESELRILSDWIGLSVAVELLRK